MAKYWIVSRYHYCHAFVSFLYLREITSAIYSSIDLLDFFVSKLINTVVPPRHTQFCIPTLYLKLAQIALACDLYILEVRRTEEELGDAFGPQTTDLRRFVREIQQYSTSNKLSKT